MVNLENKIASTDWQMVTESMNEKGYAVIPKILTDEQCKELIQAYDKRKPVS